MMSNGRNSVETAEDVQYLEAILRTMRHPLLVLDGSLTVEKANDAFLRSFDVPAAHTEGVKLYDLGNGQWDIPELRKLLERVLPEQQEVTDYPVEHAFERIGRRTMILNACTMRRQGQDSRILLSIEDVTEREQARFEMKAQKEYAEKVVDACREALLILGWDLRVKTANQTFYDNFKVAPPETEGRLVYELGNGQWDIPALRKLLEEVLPGNSTFDDYKVEHNFETIGRRTMLLNARRIDHLELILLAIEDKTEEIQAAARIEKSEEQLRGVLNAMAEGFARLGPDFTILDVNDETLRLDGRSRDALIGRSHWDAFPGSEDAPVGEMLRKVMRERQPGALEHIYGWPDGRALWLDLRVYPTPDGGVATFWRDVSDRRRSEDALRESEERYRRLFESMDEAYAVVEVLKDRHGDWSDFRFIEVNSAFLEHTSMPYPVGKTATELLGTPNPRWAQLYGRALDTNQPLRLEETERTLGRTFDLNIFALDKETNRVAVLFTNITGRKQTEAALREREQQLAALVEAVPLGIGLQDAEGTITLANRIFRDLIPQRIPSRDPERLPLWRAWDARGQLIPPSQFPGARALRGEAVESGLEMLYGPDGGTQVWKQVTSLPIRNDAGEIVGAVSAIVDIDGLKRSQSALRESEERFRAILETALDYAIFTTDLQGTIKTWPPGAQAVFGWSANEAIGKDAAMTFTPEDREAGVPQQEMAQAREHGHAPNVRWHLRSDGRRVFIEGSTRPMGGAGNSIEGFLKVGQDVTDRKHWEERQKILVAELQHRTRNLVSVVRSTAERILRSSADLDDFRLRFKDRIDALARVQGLLSRLDTHDRVTFDELIAMEMSAMGAGPDKVELKGPLDVRLRSSTVQTLAMALHELATNATKYGALKQDSGRLSISWSVVPEEDGRSWLRIEWRETGVVMPEEGAAPQGTGQGRELIERALPYQLKARTRYLMTRDGVHCDIAIPVSKTMKETAHA